MSVNFSTLLWEQLGQLLDWDFVFLRHRRDHLRRWRVGSGLDPADVFRREAQCTGGSPQRKLCLDARVSNEFSEYFSRIFHLLPPPYQVLSITQRPQYKGTAAFSASFYFAVCVLWLVSWDSLGGPPLSIR